MNRTYILALLSAVLLVGLIVAVGLVWKGQSETEVAGRGKEPEPLPVRVGEGTGQRAAKPDRPESPLRESGKEARSEPPAGEGAPEKEAPSRVEGLAGGPLGLLRSADPALRRKGVALLRADARSDPEVQEALLALVDDSDAGVRRAAVEALSQVRTEQCAETIRKLTSDPDAMVRREVVRSLARMGAEYAAEDVVGLLTDPDSGVRREAARSVARLRIAAAEDVLIEALGDSDEEVQGQVIDALGEIGATGASRQLRAMYETDPGPHRTRLVLALRQLGDEQPLSLEIIRLSRVALGDPDPAARTAALRSMVRLDREKADGTLKRALKDPDPGVRSLAARLTAGASEDD